MQQCVYTHLYIGAYTESDFSECLSGNIDLGGTSERVDTMVCVDGIDHSIGHEMRGACVLSRTRTEVYI